ncbi:MerR family transcriptional regulator [Actinokineospora sp. PR83]|uniref:MerR family transcriptional regulator n=1 Tax=Actinokineospora sp. PR83 TaxID=2884908 RepID=UPI0027E0F5BF|nr:MerR family transcriptional regulator [Actinokineospora sp. PR83]MCG8917998.1 MerR family transcriptional regulator [Actinokineospora sp. PR83]
MDETRWSVGELARAAGLTVRTLHHYDEVGLVVPSERTAAGHRRYTPADVRVLYRVRALRSLGLGLDAIAATLAGPDRLTEVLTAQLAHLDAEAARVAGLRARVGALLDHADTHGLLEALQMIERYYTPEQLAYLARRREELGEERIRAVEAEWPTLIEKVNAHLAADTPVTDPEVQALAARWSELMAAFHGGDASIQASAARMVADQPRDQRLDNGMSGDLYTYVQRAWAAAG